ncbi:CAP domain-containing protein [Oceanobacillus senegalensis]|uniref:CAP domain-containing protein n=1 Tax=Oceanobacillus senegalensis TaxID=1936063 RepID=UPI000A30FE80|nr:CAP domain-containing protein [Oceanobacillus senegalensis]
MPKLRSIFMMILIAGALWYVYGETYQQSGTQGAWREISNDINDIKESPNVIATTEVINQEFQKIVDWVTDHLSKEEQQDQPTLVKPSLDKPTNQTFSVHNIEIGDNRSDVEKQVGEPERSTLNEYGVDWVAYHQNYHNFFMVAYDSHDKVAGLYTNQDLLTSNNNITFDSSRESVLSTLGEPLKGIQKGFITYQTQNNQEHATFLIDNNYVTIFFDKHENYTMTAIQIINKELEEQKEKYFAQPSKLLMEGFEYQLFDLTNAARVNHELPVLTWEESLRKTARDHSVDMADNNYFSHTNLEGLSPFDRMKEDDIVFQLAGENLAVGQTSSIFAHEGLMNSQGHRENILKEEFESLAVGVAFNNDSQPYYTENFITK